MTILAVVFTISLFLVNQAYADFGKVHVKKGSIIVGSNKVLTYWVDSSVTSYGYKSAVDNGITNWDTMTSAFSINESISDVADIKVFVGYNELPSGTFGSATYWKTNSLGSHSQVGATSVTNGSDFNYGRIILDHYWQTQSSFGWEERSKTAGHEVGHVLGMNHFEEAPAHSGNHWMKSGKIALLYPTLEDKQHFQAKWGN